MAASGPRRVRTAILALLLAALAAGCAIPATPCDAGCHRVWQAQALDPRAWSDVTTSPRANATEPAGIAFPNATLQAIYGERYHLLRVAYAPDPAQDANASVAFPRGAPRLELAIPISWDAPRARALVHAVLANLSPRASESATLDALFANRTVSACAEAGTCPARASLAADLPEANVTGLWARLRPVVRGDEDHHLDAGDPVAKGAWTYSFGFPVARVEAREHGDALLAAANPRGRYSLLLTLDSPANETAARARLHELLRVAGAGDTTPWALVPGA